MIYEAHHSKTWNWALAGACIALSVIGFAAAGVIPTESGSNPAVGWAIVGACFVAAAIFVRRATDGGVQARVDERGVYTRKTGADPVAWDEIMRMEPMRAGIQRIARFHRKNGKAFGVNTTFYDRGIDDLTGAVRAHRPELLG